MAKNEVHNHLHSSNSSHRNLTAQQIAAQQEAQRAQEEAKRRAAKSVKQQNDSHITLMDGKMTTAIAIKDAISEQENKVRTKIGTLSTGIANFVSQCMLAGGIVPNTDWHSNKIPYTTWYGGTKYNSKCRKHGD